ncbi:MAG TPA: 4-alpha-glucanotransferase, partial [Acidimicrobiales bacterium]|nr:4-alpha-glucanotransferase [Acidimicrobiales bacterium]
YARFRAAADRLGTDWRRWPVRERAGELGDSDHRAVRYHAFVQWLVHCQLVDVARRCDARGQVLALDLPLGVHPDGYDAWRHRDQYLAGIEVGAPPDRFFPRGQGWSFPPPDLEAARRSGHALFRAALAHHLRVASMLRIDHVLGLQRLFCVPHGGLPKDGVYVECPLEELLAVVAIEAQRHRAAIVGEDLGTVDVGVRRAMARDGLRRYFAVELTVGRGGSTTFPAPPPGSVASFTTHDLATFEGWWEGRDVSELVELGQIDAATGAVMLEARHHERAALATLVDGSDGDAPPPGLLAAALERLARSDAGLVVAQLDDVLGEHEGVNLPGTSVERRNWARRTSVSLDDLEASGALAASLDPLHEVRPTQPAAEVPEPRGPAAVVHGVTRFGDVDDHLFNEGRHARLFDLLGAHAMTVDDDAGTFFAVWAPSARRVEVVGDFNGWDGARHALAPRASTGIWEGFVPGLGERERDKYRVTP